jgi:hypothetical protein
MVCIVLRRRLKLLFSPLHSRSFSFISTQGGAEQVPDIKKAQFNTAHTADISSPYA